MSQNTGVCLQKRRKVTERFYWNFSTLAYATNHMLETEFTACEDMDKKIRGQHNGPTWLIREMYLTFLFIRG